MTGICKDNLNDELFSVKHFVGLSPAADWSAPMLWLSGKILFF